MWLHIIATIILVVTEQGKLIQQHQWLNINRSLCGSLLPTVSISFRLTIPVTNKVIFYLYSLFHFNSTFIRFDPFIDRLFSVLKLLLNWYVVNGRGRFLSAAVYVSWRIHTRYYSKQTSKHSDDPSNGKWLPPHLYM